MKKGVLGEELLLVEITIFIDVCLLDEFQNVIITHDDIQILVEHLFDFGQTHQSLLFSIEQAEHVHGFVLPAPSIEPLLLDHLQHFG